MGKELFLKFPTMDDEIEYIKYQKEEHDKDIDYVCWLNDLKKSSNQVGIVDGKVPRTILFLTDGSTIYGQVSIRYRIDTPRLSKYVGNIGYEIRKEYRGRDYGNLILKLGLEELTKKGLKKVMVSCRCDNIASQCVILKNGGIFLRRFIF